MPRLSPVPDSPLRAIAYVRVSQERDEMISPELQTVAITDHCTRLGYTIVEELEDLDLSGRLWKRRKIETAIRMIEAGEADVLVVWKWSRVARNRRDWAVAVDRVEVAGGRLESATEPIDATTSSGRLARGMLAEFAAFESDRIGDVWREVHDRRTRQGLPANGKPRFGYRVTSGRHHPDDVEGPVLAALYRRYIAGESVYALVQWLNREGFRTAPGYSKNGPGPWTQMTLRRCLDSGFAAGLITVRGERVRGVHEPVIDQPTWETYLATRASRRTLRRSERSTYTLSGMLRCVAPLPDGTICGSSMGGGLFGSSRQPKFRCLAAAAERRHPGGYVTMAVAEHAVLEWLAERAARIEEPSEKVASRSPGRPAAKRDADAIAREIAQLEQQLTTASMQVVRDVLPESEYVKVRRQIEAEKRVLMERHARALLSADEVDAGPIAAALLLDWAELEPDERRAILRRLVGRVEVTPGRPVASIVVSPTWQAEKRV